MNKIGTIRDQYEWQPKGNQDGWLIEEEKMSKVQPLVDFINHAGELKSTKVGRCIWFSHLWRLSPRRRRKIVNCFFLLLLLSLSLSLPLSLSLSLSLFVMLTHSLSLSFSILFSHNLYFPLSLFLSSSLISFSLSHSFFLSRTMW